MKKLLLIAVMALAVSLVGCSKDGTNSIDDSNTRLIIKIDGVSGSNTRATEGAAQEDQIAIDYPNSHVFVVNSRGEVVTSETLTSDAAPDGAGQEIAEPVPTNSKVYVVANVPAADYDADEFKALATLDDVKALTSHISTQTDYKHPTLANLNAEAEDIVPVADANPGDEYSSAEVDVTIAPVISRLELHGVQAKAEDDRLGMITAFTVTGIYVDSYFPLFAYDGFAIEDQDPLELGQQDDFAQSVADKMGNEGNWPGPVAKPTQGVWAYQVSPGGMPRFIIALTGVKYNQPSGGAEVDRSTETLYLTLTEYTGMTEPNFLAGKVYRVGTSGKELKFGPENLWETPNPDPKAGLKVNVTVEDWKFGDYSGVLAR